jgi:hypothetical protein
VRIPPQVRPITVQHEVEQTLNKLGIDYELDVYKSLLGYEGKNVAPLVQSAEEVFQHLFGQKIKPESPDRASIWTDTNIYNELGIPAIKMSAGSAHQRPQRDRCREMLKAGQTGAIGADTSYNRGHLAQRMRFSYCQKPTSNRRALLTREYRVDTNDLIEQRN